MEGPHVVGSPVDGGKVDVELLDDTRIQRVVVHDEDVAVPKALLGLEHETALELFALDLDLGLLIVAGLRPTLLLRRLVRLGDLLALLPRRDLVRDDVAGLVESMQQNVLVPLGSVSGEGAIPVGDGADSVGRASRHDHCPQRTMSSRQGL